MELVHPPLNLLSTAMALLLADSVDTLFDNGICFSGLSPTFFGSLVSANEIADTIQLNAFEPAVHGGSVPLNASSNVVRMHAGMIKLVAELDSCYVCHCDDLLRVNA